VASSQLQAGASNKAQTTLKWKLTSPRYRTNLVIILGMMQVSKKIPFEDPQVLMGVRGLYIVSNLIIIGMYLYIQSKINSKKGFFPTPSFSPSTPSLPTSN
jgi:hypothetical protein